MHQRTIQILIASSFLFSLAANSQTMSLPSSNPPSAAQTSTRNWPTTDGAVLLPNFRFGTGETLPQLKLHYLTLGTPHRNAAGHVDMPCCCFTARAAMRTL
jgi:hypothetical protein